MGLFDKAEDEAPATFEELSTRLLALEKAIREGVGDLTMQELRRSMETDWIPDGDTFIGPHSIGAQAIGVLPHARVYSTVAQTIPTNATTAVIFNTERSDTDNLWVSTAPTRLTCQTAGLYSFKGHIFWNGAAGGVYRLNIIRFNGVTEIAGQNCPPAAMGDSRTTVTADWEMQKGDYVELCVFQDSGAPLNESPAPALAPEFSATWQSWPNETTPNAQT